MDRRLLPVALGVGAGAVQFALPQGLGILVVVAAALTAGGVLPDQPTKAAALFLLPTILLGAALVALHGDASVVGPLTVGLILAAVVAAFFTHIGAGIALRRQDRAR